jgi:hypothetical protein
MFTKEELAMNKNLNIQKTYTILCPPDICFRIMTKNSFCAYRSNAKDLSVPTVKIPMQSALEFIKSQDIDKIMILVNGNVLSLEEKKSSIENLWFAFMLKRIAPRKKSVNVIKMMEENESLKKELKEQKNVLESVIDRKIMVNNNNPAAVAESIVKEVKAHESVNTANVTNKLSAAELLGLIPIKETKLNIKDETEFNTALTNATALKDEPQWIKDAREQEKKMAEEIINKRGIPSEI